MNFKVGDRVYYDLDGKKMLGTVISVDYQCPKFPVQTVWGEWDHTYNEKYMPSDELFLEESASVTSHWQKIIDALESAIDIALENCEYDEAIELGKKLDEVKKNV